ncbi:MAG: hypothetical protein AMXMBFR12_04720 [Candidatus Babeliales bacterium]
MKKLVLSLLLSAIAINAFGMQTNVHDYRVELAKQDVAMVKTLFYPILGTVSLGIAGYFGSQMWANYLVFRDKSNQTANNSNVSVQSSWMAYAKIAAGLGLTGLSVWLGCKQNSQPQSMVNKYVTGSGSGDAGSTLSPNIMISLASAYMLAPMVPAYFLFKSGFEDLKAERELAYHKEYAKTAMVQPSSDAPKPTY